jgi:hypothetical protein
MFLFEIYDFDMHSFRNEWEGEMDWSNVKICLAIACNGTLGAAAREF